MEEKYYTSEKHIQILIYLLKAHSIKKVIASPGTTNLTFIGSIQNDPFFEIYSSVDERSAAYLACGMATETGEPVVLSCTGATASRNYLPGLTEGYYRQLPILAITSTQHPGRIEQHMPQVIDRNAQPNDTVYMSKHIRYIHTDEDMWNVVVSINEALLELRHNGGRTVHLNVETTYSRDYSVRELPAIRVIRRVGYNDAMPEIPEGRIAVFVGAHRPWNSELSKYVEQFCEKFNAVVLCDQTSNYKGKYAVFPSLVCSQTQYISECRRPKLLIHIGSISGSDVYMDKKYPFDVWRVNPDGKIRDVFKKTKYVFEMEEEVFFKRAVESAKDTVENTYYSEWKEECSRIESKIPELPFSNVWIAQQTINKIPEGSTVYFAILNTLRSWNYFKQPESINGFSNTGGFGIDGGLSTLIGASLINSQKLYYCVIGDLGFFYDMNALGNRHLGNNVRILLINNGRGTEFTNYNHPGAAFGDDAKPYFAAAGHFGNQSRDLVRHYATDLGLEYLCADNKKDYLECLEKFTAPSSYGKSILFEVFTEGDSESDAIKIMHFLEKDTSMSAKQTVKEILGNKNYNTLKKLIKH